MKGRCVCGCGRRALPYPHHAVTQRTIEQHGGDVDDPRNLLPIAFVCHGNHHARSRTLPLRVLPDSVFEFARELMGSGPAYVYLGRYYAGEDPRLDAVLDD